MRTARRRGLVTASSIPSPASRGRRAFACLIKILDAVCGHRRHGFWSLGGGCRLSPRRKCLAYLLHAQRRQVGVEDLCVLGWGRGIEFIMGVHVEARM